MRRLKEFTTNEIEELKIKTLNILFKTINNKRKNMLKPISEIASYAPFGKSKTTQLLKEMGEKGIVTINGKGRGTKYRIK